MGDDGAVLGEITAFGWCICQVLVMIFLVWSIEGYSPPTGAAEAKAARNGRSLMSV